MFKRLVIIVSLFSLESNLHAVPWKSEGVKFIPDPPTPKRSRLRKSSAPYIAADSFRAICDHICDETDAEFKPEMVRYGDTVYLTSYVVAEFFALVHSKIKAPYILVTSNSDLPNPGSSAAYLADPKILAWFGINCDIDISATKFVPIPIGLANNYWKHGNTAILASVQKASKTVPKQHLLGLNFSIWTNSQERKAAYEAFEAKAFCKIFLDKNGIGFQKYQSYLNDMASCKFIISPHGNGLDCHRTWEALILGVIPVVKSSTLDPLYRDLPVLIVNNWSEVSADFLEQQYISMQAKHYNLDKIYFSYWENLIRQTQQHFRQLAK